MELIYHKLNTIQTSPFDEALFKVSKNANPLYLVSPYIGINFLKRLVGESKNWKLVTDIEAWLSSGNQKHRAKSWQFVVENIKNIKHLPDVHAKVAIGNNLVFLGSANFTEKGILSRTEMSVLIDEPSVVLESTTWFENIWSMADFAIIHEGDELVKALNELKWTTPSSRTRLTSAAPKIKSILFSSTRPASYDIASAFALANIKESLKQQPLEDAYSLISDAWFNEGISFTFKQLYETLESKAIKVSKIDLWNLVVRETTNHWLGGVFIDGFDRYVYLNNKFIPWSTEQIKSTMFIDGYLHFMLSYLDFKPKTLPNDDDWLKVNVATHQIYHILDEFINAGLIREIDNSGKLSNYVIESDFIWPKRWKKFKNSHELFIKKVADFNGGVFKNLENNTAEFDDDFSIIESDFINNLEAIKWSSDFKTTSNQSSRNKQIRELIKTAKSLGVTVEEVIEQHDVILTAAFEIIDTKADTLNRHDAKSLVEELMNHPLPRKLIDNLNDETGGPLIFKKNGRVKIAKNWNSAYYLMLYPQSLALWNSILKKIN